MADILTGQRRFEDAHAASLEALALDRESPGYWNRVGLTLLYLGRPAEAYTHFAHASTLNTKNPAFSSNAGVALADLQRYEDALIWIDRALALRPDHLAATINRLHILISLKRYEEATAQFEAATEVMIGHSGYWSAKGSLHTKRGEYDQALAAMKRAIDLRNDDDKTATSNECMGELLITLEDYKKALGVIDQALEIRPHNFYVQQLKAKALRGLRRESEADEIERAAQARLAEQLALLDQAEGATDK
jgi:tetratricopeptide (TPR) repeat protein